MKLIYGDTVELLAQEDSLDMGDSEYVTLDYDNSSGLWLAADLVIYGAAAGAFQLFDGDDWGLMLFEVSHFRRFSATGFEVWSSPSGEALLSDAGELVGRNVGVGILRSIDADSDYWIRIPNIQLGVFNRFAIKQVAGAVIYGADTAGEPPVYVEDTGYGIYIEPWGYK